MKKIILFGFFLLSLCSTSAQDYYMTAPEGYGEAATGGAGGTTVTVTTYADLITQLKSTGKKIILVSGTLTATYQSVLINNKTVIGLPGAKLVNNNQTKDGSGILNIKTGSSNVIIRNLIFEGPGAYDADGRDNLTNEGVDVWVDHCEFQDGMDGNFDNKGTADRVTISWCKFTYLKPFKPDGSGGTDDHRFTNVVGSAQDDFPADNRFSITFKNCYWAQGCKERMPRARNAQLHILNCYYNTSITGALALGLGGGDKGTTCYVENSNFLRVGASLTAPNLYKSYNSDDGGTHTLTYSGCIKGTPSIAAGTNVGVAPKPTYTYTVLPVADVATYVPNASCGAGATLQVTTAGVISTSCPNLGVDDYTLNNAVKLYPTFVNDILNIELSENTTGEATIEIYSIAGAKVFSASRNNITADEKLSLDVASLSKGMYLCKIKIGATDTTLKFIKD